ncbi:MAG: TlpA family protein disulfide reductase, partial [Chitinophagaceae bacterium]|nr:TlpA family protein disulfide reductase [Chitinophagaceae bacterium]
MDNQNQKEILSCNVVITFLFLFLMSYVGYAQTRIISRVKIGNKVPEITIPTVINYSQPSVKLSDFKGKLLILDFWSIWCGGCIHALPELEKLQKKYQDRVVILPVAFTRSKSEVSAFFQKMKKNDRDISLPSGIYPTMQNELLTLFPCYGFPMEVWIDENGKLLAISDSFYVTDSNIERAIKHVGFSLPVSELMPKPEVIAVVKKQPDTKKDTVLFFSKISGYSDTVPLGKRNLLIRNKRDRVTRLTMLNASIVDLFRASYGRKVVNNDSWVSAEFADSSRAFFPVYDTAFYTNLKKDTYCYEMVLPKTSSYDDALALMNTELSAYFGIQSSIEKRPTLCYILRKITQDFSLTTKGEPNIEKYDASIGNVRLRNAPIHSLIMFMQSELYTKGSNVIPVVDETGYTANIDIDLTLIKKNDVGHVNAILMKYNLCLEQ